MSNGLHHCFCGSSNEDKQPQEGEDCVNSVRKLVSLGCLGLCFDVQELQPGQSPRSSKMRSRKTDEVRYTLPAVPGVVEANPTANGEHKVERQTQTG